MGKKFSNFIMGFVVAILVLPLLYALGIPSFDVVLNVIFGEGNPWAVVFSVLLIGLVIFSMIRMNKKEKQNGV